MLIGYYNRNKKQVLDMPIGPDNRIEPGGPDQGQPTHFVVGRGWGTIAIRVPKDFGDKKLTWTLTTNGRTVSVPFGITKGYQIEPFLDAAMGNKPPVIKFAKRHRPDRTAPAAVGRAGLQRRGRRERHAHVWVTDDGHEEPPTGRLGRRTASAGAQAPPRRPRVSTTLTKYRGPGDITFADNTPTIEKDKVTTTATFSVPASTSSASKATILPALAAAASSAAGPPPT